MTARRNCIATKTLLVAGWLLALSLAGAAAAADTVGTITDLSGPLVARKSDGSIKVLSQKSAVESGDTLVSEKATYARIRFVDNSNITLRPDTQFRIENFAYDAAKPDNDNAVFRLLKGGLRSVTGLLGQRSKERFALNTPTATVGIRGTTFIAEYLPPETTSGSAGAGQAVAEADVPAWALPAAEGLLNLPRAAEPLNLPAALSLASPVPASMRGLPVQLAAADTTRSDVPRQLLDAPLQLAQATGLPGSPGSRAPGLYVQVLDGIIHVTNGGGTQNFTAGQFGFTPGFQQPPVILPTNPGMQFSPPPSFSSSAGGQGGGAGIKPGQVDCQVR